MNKSAKFDFDVNFTIELSTIEKNCNAPLYALMCPLQIINDIEPLSLTLHGIITFFIHQPPPPRKSDNFDFDVIFFKEQSIAK